MVFGDIRVSTEMQTIENQRLEIEKFAKKRDLQVREWVEETISTRQALHKRKIVQLIDSMREGDILIVSELSRMARALFELMGILQKAMLKGIKILSIKEGYELGDNITSKVMAFAFGLSAEIERSMISDRTKAGLARVKAEGRILGRPAGKLSDPRKRKLAEKKTQIINLLASDISVCAIGRIVGAHRLTVDAYIKEFGLQKKAEELRKKRDGGIDDDSNGNKFTRPDEGDTK